MRTLPFLIIIAIIGLSCKAKSEKEPFQMVDYLKVKQKLDTINAASESDIYQTWRNNLVFFDSSGKKQIVFIGCSHNSSDSTHPQYIIMEELFIKSNPQVAFNEGGNWGLKGKLRSKKEAVENRAGEVAMLQYFCDKKGIDMLNGDMDEKQEYQTLFNEGSFEKTYLLFALERFVNLYKHGVYPNTTIEKAFQEKFIKKQLLAYGIALREDQKHFNYFKKIYQKNFKKPFDLLDNEPVDNYYLEDKTDMGNIHRRSKIVRDSVLLTKIDSALYKYDRVFVAFGASHIVALKPALKQILKKHE